MVQNKLYSIIFLSLFLIFSFLPSAYASDVEHLKRGFLDLVELGKIALMLVAILAVIREIFTKRNIFIMLGIIGVTAILVHLAYPDKMSTFGKKLISPFIETVETSNSNIK